MDADPSFCFFWRPERVLTRSQSQPKAQPKSAATKQNGNSKGAAAKGAVNRKRRGRSVRPAKKTTEELDSEMADYFVGNANNENANSGAPAATNGDAAMEDEIMVGLEDEVDMLSRKSEC